MLSGTTPPWQVEWTAGPIPVDTPWVPPVAFNGGEALPNNWGKEVVIKYSSNLRTDGVWYTDSNGKEMVKRVYNKRGPSYPQSYAISEPVAGESMTPSRTATIKSPSRCFSCQVHPILSLALAGNYYPVNALMSLDDGAHELAVLTDVAQATSALYFLLSSAAREAPRFC